MKECKECGSEFEPGNSKGVFCSPNCKQKDYRKSVAAKLKLLDQLTKSNGQKEPSKETKAVAVTSKRNLTKVLNGQNEPAEGTPRFFLKYGAFTHEEAKKLKNG